MIKLNFAKLFLVCSFLLGIPAHAQAMQSQTIATQSTWASKLATANESLKLTKNLIIVSALVAGSVWLYKAVTGKTAAELRKTKRELLDRIEELEVQLKTQLARTHTALALVDKRTQAVQHDLKQLIEGQAYLINYVTADKSKKATLKGQKFSYNDKATQSIADEINQLRQEIAKIDSELASQNSPTLRIKSKTAQKQKRNIVIRTLGTFREFMTSWATDEEDD